MSHARPLAIGALPALLLAAGEIFWLRLARPLENRLVDLFVRQHAARLPPGPDLVLVAIYAQSLAEMQDTGGPLRLPRWFTATAVSFTDLRKGPTPCDFPLVPLSCQPGTAPAA